MSEMEQAAGGVLWRATGGRQEYAVVHRPKYDDWSLPKGKLNAGESHQQAALREIAEETGFAGILGRELGSVDYIAKGRPKRVRYWSVEAAEGAFTPGREVDDLRWLPFEAAERLLSYERDRSLLRRFATEHGDETDSSQ